MSSAVLFLLGAIGVAVAGSSLLWAFHNLRRPKPPDYHDHLRAIAPRHSRGPVEQPSGIVPLDETIDEEH